MSALGLLTTRGGTAVLRRATLGDVPTIVDLLADDKLGATRDGAADIDGLRPYRADAAS